MPSEGRSPPPHARDTQTWTSRTGPMAPVWMSLHHTPVVVGRVNLGPHLRGEARFGGRLANNAGFPDAMRQGLLAIDVLAEMDGRHDGKGMCVLRRGHDHRVNILAGVVELAEVHVFPGLGILGGGGVEVVFVDVAQRHDVLAADFGGIRGPASARADDRDIQFLVGRNAARGWPRERPAAERGCAGGQGRVIKELTTGERAGARRSFAHGPFLRLSFWPDKHIFGNLIDSMPV